MVSELIAFVMGPKPTRQMVCRPVSPGTYSSSGSLPRHERRRVMHVTLDAYSRSR